MCLLLNLIGTPVSEEATVICVNTLLQVWLWLRRCNELLALPVPSCQCIHWTGVLRTHYLNPSPFNTNIGDSNYVLAPWDTH